MRGIQDSRKKINNDKPGSESQKKVVLKIIGLKIIMVLTGHTRETWVSGKDELLVHSAVMKSEVCCFIQEWRRQLDNKSSYYTSFNLGVHMSDKTHLGRNATQAKCRYHILLLTWHRHAFILYWKRYHPGQKQYGMDLWAGQPVPHARVVLRGTQPSAHVRSSVLSFQVIWAFPSQNLLREQCNPAKSSACCSSPKLVNRFPWPTGQACWLRLYKKRFFLPSALGAFWSFSC